jgi:hypothetical protein
MLWLLQSNKEQRTVKWGPEGTFTTAWPETHSPYIRGAEVLPASQKQPAKHHMQPLAVLLYCE